VAALSFYVRLAARIDGKREQHSMYMEKQKDNCARSFRLFAVTN